MVCICILGNPVCRQVWHTGHYSGNFGFLCNTISKLQEKDACIPAVVPGIEWIAGDVCFLE